MNKKKGRQKAIVSQLTNIYLRIKKKNGSIEEKTNRGLIKNNLLDEIAD